MLDSTAKTSPEAISLVCAIVISTCVCKSATRLFIAVCAVLKLFGCQSAELVHLLLELIQF